MNTIKLKFAVLFLALLFFASCNKEDNPLAPVEILEFLGNYSLGEGSYYVVLDSAGNPVLTEKVSIEGEIMTVTRGKADTLILSSPTLGDIKVTPSVNGQTINLNIPEQPYNGSLNPTGAEATLRTTENFYFTKKPDGKKEFNSNSGNGNIMLYLLAGNKYQVSIRRTGLS